MVLDLLIVVIFAILILPKAKLQKADIDEKLTIVETGNIKGVLCLVIFFNHFTGWFFSQSPISYLFVHCGSQAVAVFFFISAYGISQKRCSSINKTFLIKRFTKLLVPYWICIAVYSVVSVVADIEIKTVVNMKNIALAACALVDFSEIVENSWFVTAIAFMYIVYYICSKVLPKVRLSIKVTIVLILFSVLTKGKWITSSFAFPLGILFAEEEKNIRKIISKKYFLSVIILSAMMISGAFGKFIAQNYGKEIFMDISDMITGMVFTALVYTLFMRIKIGNIFTKFLSKISYEFYLLHGLMIRISYLLFGLSKAIEFCLTAIILTVFASLIVNFLSQKTQKIILKKV